MENKPKTLADYCREVNRQEAERRHQVFEALYPLWKDLVEKKIKEQLERRPNEKRFSFSYTAGIWGRKELELLNNGPDWAKPSDELIHEFIDFLVPKLLKEFGMRDLVANGEVFHLTW